MIPLVSLKIKLAKLLLLAICMWYDTAVLTFLHPKGCVVYKHVELFAGDNDVGIFNVENDIASDHRNPSDETDFTFQ